MPKFGKRSLKNLSTCHPLLQEVMHELIAVYDVSVICGHRGQAEQEKAVEEGRSKLPFPHSKHNASPSLAVDVVPYPIDWTDWKRFYYMAGLIKGIASQRGVTIRWGGDWDSDSEFRDQSFHDLPHFEVIL